MLIAAFALLLFATPAAGSTSTYSSPAMASFSLRADNGYRILVERNHGRVSLTALHAGKSFFALTSYSVRSKTLPQRIDARFGKFGRVSVRLKTERIRKGKLEEQCKGKPETIRFGVYVGTIRFRGEGGYTSVAAPRAEGRMSSGHRIRCVFPNLRPGSDPPAHALHRVPPSLGAIQGRRRAFGVEIYGGKRRSAFFSAFAQERRGRIKISRNVFARGSLDSFDFAGDLSTATVRPPKPFHGEAGFMRTPDGPVWSGTLSADFPGREDVRLAGPRFDSQLARDSSGDMFVSAFL